jgi:hypothetical protein
MRSSSNNLAMDLSLFATSSHHMSHRCASNICDLCLQCLTIRQWWDGVEYRMGNVDERWLDILVLVSIYSSYLLVPSLLRSFVIVVSLHDLIALAYSWPLKLSLSLTYVHWSSMTLATLTLVLTSSPLVLFLLQPRTTLPCLYLLGILPPYHSSLLKLILQYRICLKGNWVSWTFVTPRLAHPLANGWIPLAHRQTQSSIENKLSGEWQIL